MPKHKSHSEGFGNLKIGFWIFLLVSLILNIIFIFQNYERNRVTRVVDGDSIDLKDGRRIRLLGLDAPEREECMSSEAYDKLKNLAQGRHVRLKDVVTDDYGRILANVIVEDWSAWISYLRFRFLPSVIPNLFRNPSQDSFSDPFISRALVSEGLARFNSVNTPYKDTLKNAQDKAKQEKKGIWSETCRSNNPISACVIKGNIRAGKKTYFFPDCPNYSDVIIDTSFGDRWFCTENEASSSGFLRSSSC